MPGALLGQYGGGLYGSGLYGGGIPIEPERHVRILLDRDPLAGHVISGDNATLESLGNWTAGAVGTALTLNTARSRVHAGDACALLTATSAGDISAVLAGQGPIGAHRTYLIWAHLRPYVAAARTVRLTVTWKSGTGVTLGTATATRTEDASGWVPAGLLATAPAGVATLTLTVTVLNVLDDEAHLLDTVSCQDAGTDVTGDVLDADWTLSGRNHPLARTEAGSATAHLSDPDGVLAPGNLGPRRKIFALAEWAGELYPVWAGYVRRVVQSIPGSQARASEVALSCDDGFRWLTGVDVPPAYRAEVLADAPLSYFTLDEPSSSLSCGDIVAARPAALLASKDGAGDSAFGADSALPILQSGRNSDGGSSGLALNVAETLGTQGAVLDLRFSEALPPQIDIVPWTLEMWFRAPTPSLLGPMILFRHLVSSPFSSTELVSGFQLELAQTTGALVVRTPAETVTTTPTGVANGASRHLVLTYEDDGSAFGLVTLYVDGVEIDAVQLSGEPNEFGLANNCQVGGAMGSNTRTMEFPFVGQVSHIAMYYKRLSAERVAVHYQAGAAGYHLETDGDRVRAGLAFAAWPDADSAIDAGLTRLMPRDWSETNSLGLVQDTCAHSGAGVVMSPIGSVRALNRHRFVNEVPIKATLSAVDGTEPEASDFAPWIDDSGIENVIEVARIGGGTVVVENAASIARYGRIKGDRIEIAAASDAESITQARWRLTRTAEPMVRVDTGVWLPGASADGALWPALLPRVFGDRIEISDLPDTAPADPLDVLIGRVKHEWTGGENGRWVTTLQLEPALIDQMGVCDHPTLGIGDTPECTAGY